MGGGTRGGGASSARRPHRARSGGGGGYHPLAPGLLLVEAAGGGAVNEQKHDATDASSGLPVTVDTSWPALALEAPLEIALARARARAAQAGAKWSTGQQSGKLAEGTAAPPLRWRAVLVNSQQKTGTTAMEWLGAALLKHACEAANGEANVGSVDSAASEAIFSSAAGEDTAAATDRQAAVAATSADDATPSGGGEAHARTSCVFSRSGANANNQRTFAATFYVGGVPAAVIEFEGWAYKHDLAISAKHKKLEALTGSRINQMARQCVEKLDVPTWSRRCIEEVGLEDAFEADLAEGRLLLPGDPSLGLNDSPVDGDAVDDEEDADILVTLRTSRDPIAIAVSKMAYLDRDFDDERQAKTCAFAAATAALRHHVSNVLMPRAGFAPTVEFEYGESRLLPMAHAQKFMRAMGIAAMPDFDVLRAIEETSPENMRKLQDEVVAGKIAVGVVPGLGMEVRTAHGRRLMPFW
eukprot:PRCOL_00004164-RA